MARKYVKPGSSEDLKIKESSKKAELKRLKAELKRIKAGGKITTVGMFPFRFGNEHHLSINRVAALEKRIEALNKELGSDKGITKEEKDIYKRMEGVNLLPEVLKYHRDQGTLEEYKLELKKTALRDYLKLENPSEGLTKKYNETLRITSKVDESDESDSGSVSTVETEDTTGESAVIKSTTKKLPDRYGVEQPDGSIKSDETQDQSIYNKSNLTINNNQDTPKGTIEGRATLPEVERWKGPKWLGGTETYKEAEARTREALGIGFFKKGGWGARIRKDQQREFMEDLRIGRVFQTDTGFWWGGKFHKNKSKLTAKVK